MNKPSSIFYGWWIVAASFFIALVIGGIAFSGFTAIFEPIADEFGWSYSQISLAASLRGLEMGLLAPFTGILVDRYGPKRIIFIGGIITAGGLFLLGDTTSLPMFYGAFVLIAMGVSASSMTALTTAVANWFRKRVGLASGIAIAGFGFGGLMIPVIVWLTEKYQWRLAIIILGAGLLAIVLPLSLLIRHKPEQYGYLPDGYPSEPDVLSNNNLPTQTAETNISGKQAIKSRTFWHVTIAFTLHVVSVSAVGTHIMPYLSNIGFSRSLSGLAATALPLVSTAARVSFGPLADTFSQKWIAALGFAGMTIGLLFFEYIPSGANWMVIPFIALFGMGWGGGNVLRPSLIRSYFGRNSFGTIFGFAVGVNMLGGILGPFLAGWVFDNQNSYQGIWLILAGTGAAAALAILTIPGIKFESEAE